MLKKLFIIAALLIAIQPIAMAAAEILPTVQTAHAQDSNPAPTILPGSPNEAWDDNVDGSEDGVSDGFINDDELAPQPGQAAINTFNQLSAIAAIGISKGLQISPQDLQQLNDDNVDVRTTDYLNYLVMPTQYGGAGLTNIKVARIFKNYSTTGTGQYDQETLAAIAQDDSTISTHARGEAVDISGVGAVTCKIVETTKELVGGNKVQTIWEPANPVDVAWQSTYGIASDPTPTGASLVGSAGSMTGQGIASFFNQSGQLNSTVSNLKGLDLGTIFTQVGGDTILNDLGVKSISSDPTAGSLLETIGGALMKQALPGIPNGSDVGNDNESAPIAIAQAQIAQSLGLPAGSITGFGWDSILTSVGERQLESSLNLPTMYLTTHSLSDLNNNPVASAELNQPTSSGAFTRADDSLNVPTGTVALIKNDDPKALKLAGVNILAAALKLTTTPSTVNGVTVPSQKAVLLNDVQNNLDPSDDSNTNPTTSPYVNLLTVPTNNQVNNSYLSDMFLSGAQLNSLVSQEQKINSSTTNSSKKVSITNPQQELQSFGDTILTGITNNPLNTSSTQSTNGNAQPTNTGLDQSLLNQLAGSNPPTLGDLKTQIGVNNISSNAGLSDAAKADFAAGTANTSIYQQVASYFNNEFDLTGNNVITASDTSNIAQVGSNAIEQKVGGAQADTSFGWFNGTGLGIINGTSNLGAGFDQSFSNAIAGMLDLNSPDVSLSGNVPSNFGSAIISQRAGVSSSSMGNETLGALVNNLYGGSVETAAVSLGVSQGTISSNLTSLLNNTGLLQAVGSTNLTNEVSTDKISAFFGLSSSQIPSNLGGIVSALPVMGTPGSSVGTTLGTIEQTVSRSVESKAGFQTDSLLPLAQTTGDGFITSSVQTLFKQGVQSFIGALGANIPNLNPNMSGDQYTQLVSSVTNSLIGSYNNALTPPSKNPAGIVTSSNTQLESVTSFVDQASEIPAPYQYQPTSTDLTGVSSGQTQVSDDSYLVTGDFTTAMDIASFPLDMNAANPYNPPSNQLTYDDMRNTVIPSDAAISSDPNTPVVTSSTVTFEGETPIAITPVTAPAAVTTANLFGRQVTIDDATKNAGYKMSDGFLRKSNPAIPAGFSQIMATGTGQQRTAILQQFAANTIATAINIPGVSATTLMTVLNGQSTSQQDQQIGLAIIAANFSIPGVSPATIKELTSGNSAQQQQAGYSVLNAYIAGAGSGISLGPLNGQDLSLFATYIENPSQSNSDLTDPKYTSAWNGLNSWLSSTTGINLPAGFAESIYSATQSNDWTQVEVNLQAQGIKDLETVASGWADKELGLPPGTTMYIMNGNIANQQKAEDMAAAYLANKIGGGNKYVAQAIQARQAFAQGQAQGEAYVIDTALDDCSACQQFFSSIDGAINAPPGFTNQVVDGAIAMYLGLGPAGLYVAAAEYALYQFGYGKTTTQYLCPTPPQDQYAITDYDPSNDKYTGGYTVTDPTIPISSGPVSVATTPDGSRTYIVNQSSSTGSNTASSVASQAYSPAPGVGSVFGNNTDQKGSVSVADTGTNQVIATIGVGDTPIGIAITPDGKYAYVTNSGSSSDGNSVSVISTATNSVVATIKGFSSPADISMSADGSIAYVTNSSSNNISEINTANNTISKTVGLNTPTYSDGKDSHLWMGWARYNVGNLLNATITYGDDHTSPYALQQVLTYRKANAAFFEPASTQAFNDVPGANPSVGLGFTQDSTKTVGWVYVAFGGLY